MIKNKGLETKCGVITTLCNNNNNNNYNKIKQATGHSVSGEISDIPINPIDGMYHGADWWYNKLQSLPGFHKYKIWKAARATSAAPTFFRDMFIDMPEAIAFDLTERNIYHTKKLGRNPVTNEFNLSYLFLTDKVLIGLNQCAQDFYHLIKNKTIYTKTHRNKKMNEITDTINQISCSLSRW